jgi:hypothetical protein
MLRKRPIRRSTGKNRDTRGISAQPKTVPLLVNMRPVARDQTTTPRRIEARLKSAARESFQNMGED